MSDILQNLSPLADVVTRLDAQKILCIGHNKLYDLLRRGELEAVKDGAKTLITIESLKRYRAKCPRAVFLPPVEPNYTASIAKLNERKRRRRAKVASS